MDNPKGVINARTGAAVASMLLNTRLMILRKVDSIRLMDGTVGRRRISFDILPPALADIAYYRKQRRRPFRFVKGPIMVPLAMIDKGALRDFDICLGDGTPLNILGRNENSALAAAAVISEISTDAFRNNALISAILEIASGPPDDAFTYFKELEKSGSFRGQPLFDPRTLSQFGADLLANFARSFMLVALIPSQLAGQRIIVKYSSHWDVTDWSNSVKVRDLLGASAGYIPLPLNVVLSGASDPLSYHLEVHAPSGLYCAGLLLPPNDPKNGDTGSEAQSQTSVAHVVNSYTTPPDEDGQVQFTVPNGGLRAVATLVAIASALVFWLDRLLPNGHVSLLNAPEGSVALLLAVPAVVIALLARPNENDLTARLLLPLRIIVLACSLLLGLAAASLVGKLLEPWMSILWWGGSVFTATATLYMLVGYWFSRRR